MRLLLYLTAALLVAGLGACAQTIPIPTNPATFDVAPEHLSRLRSPQSVSLLNAYSGEEKTSLRVGQHTWVFDVVQLTDTAIAMLDRAMEKRGLSTSMKAEKKVTLKLRVVGANFSLPMLFLPQSTVSVDLDATLGDGTKIAVSAENTSPAGGQRAVDGAVLFALNGLLEDERFVAYMNK